MGIGVYLIWPVFYTDVTDSYRLDRRGRLRTDLGGVYFNVLYVLAIAGTYFLTGYPPLLVVLVLIQLETLQRFLPFLRLDGYYVVSDLVGVPNLFAYLRPVLVTLTPGSSEQERDHRAGQVGQPAPLGPAGMITGWVVVTTPILLVNVILLLAFAPALAGAAWGALQLQVQNVVAAREQGEVVSLLNGVVGLVLLASPVVGTLFVAAMAGRRVEREAQVRFARPPAAARGHDGLGGPGRPSHARRSVMAGHVHDRARSVPPGGRHRHGDTVAPPRPASSSRPPRSARRTPTRRRRPLGRVGRAGPVGPVRPVRPDDAGRRTAARRLLRPSPHPPSCAGLVPAETAPDGRLHVDGTAPVRGHRMSDPDR